MSKLYCELIGVDEKMLPAPVEFCIDVVPLLDVEENIYLLQEKIPNYTPQKSYIVRHKDVVVDVDRYGVFNKAVGILKRKNVFKSCELIL